MDEMPSNKENPELRKFRGSVPGAMFADRGEQSAGNSSTETGWVPMIARRPSNLQAPLHDMAMVGSNELGLDIPENASLVDARMLMPVFQNMTMGFTDGAAESAVKSCRVPFRDGYSPTGLVISSADSARSGSLQRAFPQTHDFAHSPHIVNNAEHLKTTFGDQIPQVYTGMDGSDNPYVTSINLPPASPFQKQHFINELPQKYALRQRVDPKFRWHDIDVERPSIMQKHYSYNQMPPIATSDVRWIDSSQCGAFNSSPRPFVPPHLRTPIVHPVGHDRPDFYWNGAMDPKGNNQTNPTTMYSSPCMIYPDRSCETCEYSQIQLSEKLKYPYRFRHSHNGLLQNHISDKVEVKNAPAKILMKSEGLNSIMNINPGYALNRCADGNKRTSRGQSLHLNIQSNNSLHYDLQSSQFLSSFESDLVLNCSQFKYNSLDEVFGELYLLAKDQNGCRFLQRIFTEGSQDDSQKVFDGVIEHIDELMVDPFGNYLVQKLLEECKEDQKMLLVYEITKRPGQLIKVSCNMHGTRVVQKVIETIKNSDEVSMVVSALSPGAITLMMDANGCHVALRCLQKLSPEYKAFLLNTAIEYCFMLAQDRQGCCIIQKCILHANTEQKNSLLYNITSRALDLAEHQYGNYVIQYILSLSVIWATDGILDKLEGHYGYLSMQKCSSNVVEKCIKEAQEPKRVKIIHELISDPKLLHILLDQYGNYVVQTALRECKDAVVQAALIDAIRPHTAALRNSMFGKRILSKTCLKYRKN